MGFGKDLAKGLIRSAVNQVGRDAGKVVSNNLYGDAHAVPHRSVNGSGSGSSRSEFVGMDEKEIRTERCPAPSNGTIVLWIVLGLMFNLLGGIALLLAGFSRWNARDTVKGWRVYSVPVYVSDRRYKGGMRYDGDEIRKKRVTLLADELEIERNIIVARAYMYAGAAILLFSIILLNLKG